MQKRQFKQAYRPGGTGNPDRSNIMTFEQAAILALESLQKSCDENGKPPLDDNDAFLRGFAAAHRKIGAFIPHIIEYLKEEI